MPFVYIIQDKISKKYYTGSCVNLKIRLSRHKRHTAARTTRQGEWNLVCYLETKTIQGARLIERKIKSYKGGNAFKRIINGEIIEWESALPRQRRGELITR